MTTGPGEPKDRERSEAYDANPFAPPRADEPVGSGTRPASPHDDDGAPYLEPLHDRARLAIGAFVVTGIGSAVSLWSELTMLDYLQGVARGFLDGPTAESVGTRHEIVGGLQLFLVLVTAVAFLVWFHRAHKNLKTGGLEKLRYTPGWAVGGFFVPVLNLVRPYQIMKEVWSGSASLSGKFAAHSSKTGTVALWWTTYLASSVIDNAAAQLSIKADELDELINASRVAILSELAGAPALVMVILVVLRVTAFQEQARLRLQRESATMPAAEEAKVA